MNEIRRSSFAPYDTPSPASSGSRYGATSPGRLWCLWGTGAYNRLTPVQLGVGGPIDLPHAFLADKGGYVVVAEAGADFERHGVRLLFLQPRWLTVPRQVGFLGNKIHVCGVPSRCPVRSFVMQ